MQSQNPYQSSQVDSSNLPVTKLSVKDILFSFNGRIPRRTYWLWSIIIGVIFFAIYMVMIVPIFVQQVQAQQANTTPPSISPVVLIIFGILCLFIFFMSLAIGVKRWHDRDKSGWFALIGFIPIVGPIWTFVECGCLRGTVGANRFGGDPT